MQHSPRPDTTRLDDSPVGVAATASRFFGSMRRSFSPPRRKITESPRAAMYSTPEERHAYSTARASRSRHLDSRPTIEQISMGLHVSRTPHLTQNPLHRHPAPSLPPSRTLIAPASPQYRTRHSLPPPPSRSSMKKTSPSVSTLTHSPQQVVSAAISPSASVIASSSHATSGSSRPLSSLRARMSKFIPGYRPLSSPSSLGRASSFTSSASDSTRPATPRKAVRFSTSVLAIDEQS